MTEDLSQETKDVIESTLVDRVAALNIAGISIRNIAKELNITPYRVTKLMNGDEFRQKLKEISDKFVGNAANAFKAALSERIPEALRVIDARLKINDLQAVQLIAKAIGVDKADNTQQQTGTIQVILPESPKPTKVVDIEV